jgi:tRNA 2-thiouridine synthesizing protein A
MSGDPLLVDARGLLCPWPVLRLSRAARELGPQGQIRIVADDPAAPREIASLCTERGWALAADPTEKDAFLVALSGDR